jgi:outer membrane protein OmpA-like peptidoglycan-associated protein
MAARRIFVRHEDREDHWIPIVDMMSGLMILLLFIAVGYMAEIVSERDRMQSEARAFHDTQDRIYGRLTAEFRKDLTAWNATIERPTLAVRFREPDVLFAAGDAKLKPAFEAMLRDFFPRYLAVLSEFREQLAEVRIEGHTSSEWAAGTSPEQSYFHNMKLSQDRTRAVLEFCLGLEAARPYRDWLIRTVTANGLASARPVVVFGREDKERSRRVEFRVRVDADSRIEGILGKN